MTTKAKVPVKRVIFDNYDIDSMYREDAIRELEEDPDKEQTEDNIYDLCSIYSRDDWDLRKEELKEFFDNDDSEWILVGSCGRWDGTYPGGFVFSSFDEMHQRVSEDCDYWRFWDENGHFYGSCTHHDGTNSFEIKKLTKRGEAFFHNWEYAYHDKRYECSEAECHKKLFEKYSVLPNFCHKVYGCEKIAFESAS